MVTLSIDKNQLKAELVTFVENELAGAERAYRTTIEGATHEEAKPENDKDTRALEQTYLARGQGLRVETMRTTLAEVRAMAVDLPPTHVALGALVTIEEEDETSLLFIAPGGGGARLAAEKIQVVTPKSPLGAALVGRHVDDVSEVRIGGRVREMTITKID